MGSLPLSIFKVTRTSEKTSYTVRTLSSKRISMAWAKGVFSRPYKFPSFGGEFFQPGRRQ